MELYVLSIVLLVGALAAYSFTLVARASEYYRSLGFRNPFLQRQRTAMPFSSFLEVDTDSCADTFWQINRKFFAQLGADNFPFVVKTPYLLHVRLPLGARYEVRLEAASSGQVFAITAYRPPLFHWLLLPGFFVVGSWISRCFGVAAILSLLFIDVHCSAAGILSALSASRRGAARGR